MSKLPVGEQTNTNIGGRTMKTATVPQIDAYLRMCNTKKVTPDPFHATWTVTEMSAKIEELYLVKVFRMASPAQINKIIEIAERLNMPRPMVEKMDIQQASTLMQRLFDMEKKMNASKVSDKQKEMIADMLKCPEVMDTIDVEKVSRQEASDFIEAWNSIYNAWKWSRATDGQIKFIQTLQERNGDRILSVDELRFFDKEGAKGYIDQLQKELKDKQLTAYTLEPTVDFRRPVLTLKQLQAQEFEDMQEMIHNLYASIGQEAEHSVLTDSNIVADLESLIQLVYAFVGLESLVEMCEKVLDELSIKKIVGVEA